LDNFGCNIVNKSVGHRLTAKNFPKFTKRLLRQQRSGKKIVLVKLLCIMIDADIPTKSLNTVMVSLAAGPCSQNSICQSPPQDGAANRCKSLNSRASITPKRPVSTHPDFHTFSLPLCKRRFFPTQKLSLLPFKNQQLALLPRVIQEPFRGSLKKENKIMRRQAKGRPEMYEYSELTEGDYFEELRYAAAQKLCIWHEHEAGGGSRYIMIGDSLTLRFADHANTSNRYETPDFNFVKSSPTEAEFKQIVDLIQYPKLAKKTAFAMHVGLTVPKLKSMLSPSCYEDYCENEAYPNTYTQFINVEIALQTLSQQNVNTKIPIKQEIYSDEDYAGF
jgi:hypothetical protein